MNNAENKSSKKETKRLHVLLLMIIWAYLNQNAMHNILKRGQI